MDLNFNLSLLIVKEKERVFDEKQEERNACLEKQKTEQRKLVKVYLVICSKFSSHFNYNSISHNHGKIYKPLPYILFNLKKQTRLKIGFVYA